MLQDEMRHALCSLWQHPNFARRSIAPRVGAVALSVLGTALSERTVTRRCPTRPN